MPSPYIVESNPVLYILIPANFRSNAFLFAGQFYATVSGKANPAQPLRPAAFNHHFLVFIGPTPPLDKPRKGTAPKKLHIFFRALPVPGRSFEPHAAVSH